ncbi:uncharacterized protein ACA1_228390 [Acanthamoeba castellanii str. Neff]|uniref:Uncharacterized protein n=1 Tax=Acanthamoeba castellanii (strain ATCC 30010 / Neff) TaxID=1257118 RepID=L8HA71_ACACF|nr:uncharacterized protein ACA1_228390 [Acanthamoeba castellanii str. Neff]ELR21588.1 hypothetical protein ACA1_228390 [Acanthamoeba castellanii str. Neff]
MDAILTIALRHVRAFLEGTRDCMRDIADMGISSCFRSWSHLFFYLGKILPGCITAAQEGEVSEDNQSARECIVEVLQIIDTVITTVFITAKQFRERPEYPVTMVRFFEFISVMLPLFSSVWDAGWDERLQSDEAPLVATHDQWFSDFFRFAAESDAGLDKQGLYLLSFQKDLCKNLLRGGTLLDDQKNELAAFFPGVSGNLGLEWHTNLPSSLGAFKPAKEKEKEEEEKEEDEKEEEEGDENGDLEHTNQTALDQYHLFVAIELAEQEGSQAGFQHFQITVGGPSNVGFICTG